MPITSGSKTYNNFVAGMITEASPLTFPPNASIDEANFNLNRNGSRQRRLGMGFESEYSLVNTGELLGNIEHFSVSFSRWDSPNNSALLSIGVVQVKNKLWFLDLTTDNPSANLLNGGNPFSLTSFDGSSKIQYAEVNGILIISAENLPLQYLKYDETTDTISSTSIDIKIRDLVGVTDGYDIVERPVVLDNNHLYNLYNQGWDIFKIGTFSSYYGTNPSHADIWHLARNSSGVFTPSVFQDIYVGNAQSARGRYIIDAFNRGASRTAYSGVAVAEDKELGRITTVASFAGRVFYSGVNSNILNGDDSSPKYNGYVFFSPVVSANKELGNCYQEADPTSEFISDLVDTDGGYVSIPEANRIYRLVSIADSIFVFAGNGIWVIGGATKGFVATEYSVKKISSVGIESPDSVVLAEDQVFFWSKGGIYKASVDTVSAEWVVVNISESTIQTYYNNINPVARKHVTGAYDSTTKKISWLFNNDTNYNDAAMKNIFNAELILDVTLGAFFPYYIGYQDGYPFVTDYVSTDNFIINETLSDVLVGVDNVVVGSDPVKQTTYASSENPTTTRYLTLVPGESSFNFTLSYYTSTTFKDWYSFDFTGLDYTSYLITGYELADDVMRKKQVPYIFFYFKKTETGFDAADNLENPSSCFVQSRWDWTGSASAGKWGTPFQVYRFMRNFIGTGPNDDFDYGYDVIVSRSKLRGRGRSLSLNIYSESGKDMHLLGWASVFTGGTTP